MQSTSVNSNDPAADFYGSNRHGHVGAAVERSAPADQLAALNPAHLFGTTEIHSSNLKIVPEMARHARAVRARAQELRPDQCKKKELGRGHRRLRGKELMTQLREINTEMNDKRTSPIVTESAGLLGDRGPFQFHAKNGDARTTRSPSTWR